MKTEPLDLPHYEAIGTMAHALDQHAEQAYAELSATPQQQICEQLFKALTDKATDPRGVRRPTALRTLCALAGATAAEVTDVIDVYRDPSRSFLMPPAGEALGGDAVIDISHESLMRVWQRLNTWADEEAQSAQTYRRLADAAALHAAGTASLWRDPELHLALDWRDRSHPNETWAARYHAGFAAAMDFLEESLAQRQREEAEKEAARQAEIRRQHELAEAAVKLATEQRRRARVAVVGVIVALLLAGFGGYEALHAIEETAVAHGAEVRAVSTLSRSVHRARRRDNGHARGASHDAERDAFGCAATQCPGCHGTPGWLVASSRDRHLDRPHRRNHQCIVQSGRPARGDRVARQDRAGLGRRKAAP